VRFEVGFTSDFPEELLLALNGSRAFMPNFAGLERTPAPPPLKFSLRVKDEALHRRSQEAFLSRLRGLADAWIETGREASGEGEDPNRRKLTRGLRRVVNEWWARNRPDVIAEYDGEPALSMPLFKVNFTGDGTPLQPMDAASEEAVRWFSWFLNLPHRLRLCKCRSCSEYYYTGHRPKGRISYGTYCPTHRHRQTARRSNERRRVPIREQKLDIAARCWGTWPKTVRGDGRQAQWVAEKINEQIRKEFDWAPVKRNWVTHHGAEIERRSRELCGTAPNTTAEKPAKGNANAKS
jgi:hypothetical protein